MNILEARRRMLGGEVYKKTAEGNPVSVRSLARMRPGLKLFGRSEQFTTTGAQLFNFSNAMQKIIGNWGLTNILSAPDTNDISIQWENLSGQAQSYIAIVCPFSFENGKTIYITRGVAQHFLVYDNDGQNIANAPGETYTPNERFDGYVGIGIDIGKDFNSPLVITYDKNFSTAEPYTGGKPSPSPDYPQEITSAGDDGSIDVDVTGANLFDIENLSPDPDANGIASMVIADGGYEWESQNAYDVNRYRIAVKPNTNYTTSVGSLTSNANLQISDFLQKTETGLDHVIVGNMTAFSFNPGELSEVTLSVFSSSTGANKITHIMLCEGNSVKPYEPYKQPQSLTVQTPNGLPGIPVASGGNYTDETGQKWICDEIDFNRGKYVKRVEIVKGEDFPYVSDPNNSQNDTEFYTKIDDASFMLDIGMSNKFINYNVREPFTFIANALGYIYFRLPPNATKEDAIECLKHSVFYLGITTPIETDLSEEQLSAYANLHTNRPTTVVSATDDAGIKLTYKTKKSLEVT